MREIFELDVPQLLRNPDEYENIFEQLMRENKVSVSEISKVTGFSQKYIQEVINGDRFPGFDNFEKIIDAIESMPSMMEKKNTLKATLQRIDNYLIEIWQKIKESIEME